MNSSRSGARTVAIEADFADTDAPATGLQCCRTPTGAGRALIVNHTLCVVRPLLATTAELFDRHLAVNARGALLLIQEFANRYKREVARDASFPSPATTRPATSPMGSPRAPPID